MISSLALFLALAGGSYAAINLPKNSVGPKQLKKNAVTSVKVKAGSLLTSDFKASQRPGLRGPQGVQGPPGANGATNVVMRQGADTTIGANTFDNAEVSCQPGERATGGGVFNQGNVLQVQMTGSYPLPNPTSGAPTGNGQTPTGWGVWMRNDSATPYVVQPYVICASP